MKYLLLIALLVATGCSKAEKVLSEVHTDIDVGAYSTNELELKVSGSLDPTSNRSEQIIITIGPNTTIDVSVKGIPEGARYRSYDGVTYNQFMGVVFRRVGSTSGAASHRGVYRNGTMLTPGSEGLRGNYTMTMQTYQQVSRNPVDEVLQYPVDYEIIIKQDKRISYNGNPING